MQQNVGSLCVKQGLPVDAILKGAVVNLTLMDAINNSSCDGGHLLCFERQMPVLIHFVQHNRLPSIAKQGC